MTDNRLRFETSPYLLQHKDNPVHWRAWGPAVFEEAQRLDKPILLSIGYSACHWCHVMAHESFENPEIAALMNALFINVKVDREERPDVDQVYMAGLQALGGRGGWPLTAFLTPKGELYWGGTYFPPTARFGRAGFPDVLRQVENAYREEPDRVAKNAARAMSAMGSAQVDSGVIGPALLDETADAIAAQLDPVNGGLQGAPKFPQASLFEFLFRDADRRGAAPTLDAFLLVMTRICEGGIYDHVAGGFARYSVDERWHVPHFEKMLYDNAQLVRLLTFAWNASRRPLFSERIAQTIDWLAREMRTPDGAFAASLNADSEGVEGKFYVWTLAELEAALGPQDARTAAAAYGATAEGNWEGVNILHRLDAPSGFDEAQLARIRERLLAARSARIPPSRDDKILADWNGLAIEALAHAAAAFDRADWFELARAAYDVILRDMVRNDRVGHSARLGRASHPGLASDAACVIAGALALHEVSGSETFLQDALRLQSALERFHFDAKQGFLLTASDAADLGVRPGGARDDATPNPNAVCARNLVRLGILTGDTRHLDRANRLFEIFGGAAMRQPFWHLGLLNAFDFAARSVETILIGPQAASRALARAAFASSSPNLALARFGSAQNAPPASPAHGRAAVNGEPTAYVCRGGVCSLPLLDPAELARELRGPTI